MISAQCPSRLHAAPKACGTLWSASSPVRCMKLWTSVSTVSMCEPTASQAASCGLPPISSAEIVIFTTLSETPNRERKEATIRLPDPMGSAASMCLSSHSMKSPPHTSRISRCRATAVWASLPVRAVRFGARQEGSKCGTEQVRDDDSTGQRQCVNEVSRETYRAACRLVP